MPHKVKTLYLPSFDSPKEIVDISDSIDLKLKALATHKSQIDSATVERVRERSKQIGKKLGYSFAESFIKLNLMF